MGTFTMTEEWYPIWVEIVGPNGEKGIFKKEDIIGIYQTDGSTRLMLSNRSQVNIDESYEDFIRRMEINEDSIIFCKRGEENEL